MLFTLCVRITRDATLAEDAVQEGLFNAWRHIAEFDGRSSFKTWLHRIAVNAALEQLRRNARHESVDANTQVSDDDDDFLPQHGSDEPSPNNRRLVVKSGAMSPTTSLA